MNCFSRFSRACEAHFDFVFEEVKCLLDGTRKKKVTDWWLQLIEEKADQVRAYGCE